LDFSLQLAENCSVCPQTGVAPGMIRGFANYMSKPAKHVIAVVSITAIGVFAYLPTVDNSFISDDFGIFPLLKAFEDDPTYIFETSSELFRVMSYVYFWGLFKVFGASPEPYYWAGIGLHIVVSALLYSLVLRLTGVWSAALAAGLFFAAYERHQEAVMWISAANETVLTLNCLLFLLLWDHAVARENRSRIVSAASLVVFALSLFSKEAAVVLAPLALLILIRHGYSAREMIDKLIPIVALLSAYIVAWLSHANRNFFLTDGHYALGVHAVSVYARTLLRLLSPAIPFLAAAALLRNRRALLQSSAFVFFAALMIMAIVPYSFLTYQDHLPSRHTYFPSLGLAAVIGILLAGIYQGASSVRLRHAGAAVFACLLAGNVAYIWLKKEPQYRERAAPTRELLQVLNSRPVLQAQRGSIHVCGFPLQRPWWFDDAISRFTPLSPDDIVLREECSGAGRSPALLWDTAAARYVLEPGEQEPPSTIADSVVRN
jgi:hypothetical protein